MSYLYQALAKREKVRAKRLADSAKAVGMGAISGTLAVSARIAVQSVQADNGRGDISEPASDLRELRTHHKFILAKDKDLTAARIAAYNEIFAGIKDGYEYDVIERGRILEKESTGLQVRIDLTDAELNDMADFPIQGRSAREWAQKLVQLLEYAIDETAAKPLSNGYDVKALPSQMYAVAQQHADRLAFVVTEAFYAGTKASMNALRSALVQHAH